MSNQLPYTPKQFALNGLNGISDRTLEMHFKLYEGYVKETNNLREQIARLRADGKVDQKRCRPTRSLHAGWALSTTEAWCCMSTTSVTSSGVAPVIPTVTRPSIKRRRRVLAATLACGLHRRWQDARGGLGICYQDPVRKRLSSHWVTLHEVGNVAGFTPMLVMDVWEHASLLDYKPSERPKYIDAFFSNIDWHARREALAGGRSGPSYRRLTFRK